jgi:predicted ATPase/class 3 adenylate cyclase
VSEALERRLVAVMFTDMVGYTALLQADEQRGVDQRERYIAALERHHDDLGGTIVQRLGDGSMSMFPSALAAVQAATAIQRELAAQDVAARVGIHVGEVIVEPERLTGDTVNIAARIESFAVPGGVMLSDDAYAQLRNRGDVSVVPHGRFRLKNVGRPFELYSLAAEGLVIPEPGLLEGKGERLAALSGSLPDAGSPLVGRAADLAALSGLVRDHRVVTITGPGGVGKTRVLSELGRQLAPEFIDGVAFVAVADVSEPDAFVPALAEALDVKEAEGRTLGEGIDALIGARGALLLLDNLEQVVGPAAAEVGRLVESCPALRVISTSRTPLRIAAEREYQLSPLGTDAAVELFAERAKVTRPAFELTEETTPVVEALCRRLDGLPLALELAAARLRLLTPAALLERLDHALDVLVSGSRDSAERQRTLRATIEWSHSLLEEPDQRLFRRLAVFAGGCTLADVESVCGAGGGTCLDELESLVDKALVHPDPQSDRLRLLETIREFAGERLAAAGETSELAAKHARRYAAVAREIREGVEGDAQVASVERGIEEEANLQAALDTFLALARAGDREACEGGLQMCADLWMYWHVRGKNLTAWEQARSFLDADAERSPTVGRAGALLTAALGSWMGGRIERAKAEWEEAYEIASALSAPRELCVAAVCQSTLGLLGYEPEDASRWARLGVELSREHGLDFTLAIGLVFEGMLNAAAGDPVEAEARFSQALAIQEAHADLEGAGMSLGGLAQLAAARGDTVEALDLYRQSLAAFEGIGDRGEEARVLSEMAWTHLANGDTSQARSFFFESVQAHTDIGSVRGAGQALVGLAAAEAVEGRPETAAQIAAAAEVHAQEEGVVVVYSDETPGRELVERARAALSAEELAHATEMGRRLTIKEALELARPARAIHAA